MAGAGGLCLHCRSRSRPTRCASWAKGTGRGGGSGAPAYASTGDDCSSTALNPSWLMFLRRASASRSPMSRKLYGAMIPTESPPKRVLERDCADVGDVNAAMLAAGKLASASFPISRLVYNTLPSLRRLPRLGQTRQEAGPSQDQRGICGGVVRNRVRSWSKGSHANGGRGSYD